MMTVTISIADHLAEYITGKYYNDELKAIKFPENDDIWVTIWNLTIKRPEDKCVDAGNIKIVLPERRIGKRPETYNYITTRGAKIIERLIKQRMRAEFHEYLQVGKHKYGYQYIDSADLFLSEYNIKSMSVEAIIKDHKRWRDDMAFCRLKYPKRFSFFEKNSCTCSVLLSLFACSIFLKNCFIIINSVIS